MTIERILVVDDELPLRNFLAETLKRKKFEVTTAENGKKALALLKENSFDMVITDLKLPDLTGIDLLRKVKENSPETMVIIITAYGSIENAVEAMRLGAFHYLIKPFSPDAIEAIIDKAKEHNALQHENQYLRQQISTKGSHVSPQIIAESPIMKQILGQVINVAKSNASVFIHGESGTGKEVISQAIHQNSLRSGKPFIKVNCAAVPETLMESEFFGHEKGAFTGANARHLGRFELANGGTLLLDEITETPPGLQAKLLRATQEQEFERVGGTKPVQVDVRLISTSNRDMKEAIAEKKIREDLYYRLNVIPIHIPALRERKEDIIPLAEYFLEKMVKDNKKSQKKLTQKAAQKLLDYAWPGNVRELANLMERAVVLDEGTTITPEHIMLENVMTKSESAPIQTGTTLQELEKKLIIETLHSQKNDQNKAAEILGISLRKLRSKINEFDLKV